MGYSIARKSGYIAVPMKNIGPLQNALSHIADPSARKLVIMSKYERGELTANDAQRLIREGGLVNA